MSQLILLYKRVRRFQTYQFVRLNVPICTVPTWFVPEGDGPKLLYKRNLYRTHVVQNKLRTVPEGDGPKLLYKRNINVKYKRELISTEQGDGPKLLYKRNINVKYKRELISTEQYVDCPRRGRA